MKYSRLVLATALSSALLLSGCGSSSEGSSSKKDDSASGGITAADIATAAKFVGGKEGKADPSKTPFTIGFVNGQGGVPAFPEQEKAADAAVGFINDQLGGIDGHPVKLVKCFVQAEEDGQKCASELLQAKVNIASVGTIVYGNATLYKLIGGEFPTIVSIAASGADSTTKDVYVLDGGGITTNVAVADVAVKAGWKNLAVISSNNPAAKFLMTSAVLPYLKKNNISPTTVYVADTATTPDYVSALQNAGAAKSDGIFFLTASVQGCISLYDAMKQVSITKPVTTTNQCSDNPMPEKTGGGAKDWTLSAIYNSALIKSPESDVYNHVMDAAGSGAVKNNGFPVKTFSDFMTIAKLANAVGFDNLSSAALTKQITDFTGTVWFGPGPLKCGLNPTQIGLCGNTAARYAYVDGAWKSLPPFTE